MVGIDRKLHYKWLDVDEDGSYREAFDAAMDTAADRLEEEARRRAVEGVEEPVGWYQGEPGGYVRKYSDTLLIFLLKGARPQKYRERVEQSSDETPDQIAQRAKDLLAQMEEADGVRGAA